MKQYGARGFVIRRQNLGEADRLITFFTLQRGKLRASARGVRKTKSRLSGHLEPFIDIELRIVEGRNIDTIIGAKPITVYQPQKGGLESVTGGWLIMEVVNKMLPEAQAQLSVYHLMQECFAQLAVADSAQAIENYFLLRITRELGYLPELPNQLDQLVQLDLEHGQFMPSSVSAATSAIMLEPSILKLWRFILAAKLTDVLRITNIAPLSEQSLSILYEFYRYRFEFDIRSTTLL